MSAPPRWLPPVDRRAGLVFALALGVLLAPWPVVGRGFGAVFSAYANTVTRGLGLGGEVAARFSVPPAGRAKPEDGGDWAVALGAGGADDLLLDTRMLGYTPIAVLLALAAASKLPRRRRLLVLAFGLACLLARSGVAIALPVARAFDGRRAGWAFGPFAELVWFGLVTPPVMSYATPLLAWWIGFALTTPPETKPTTAKPATNRPRARRRR